MGAGGRGNEDKQAKRKRKAGEINDRNEDNLTRPRSHSPKRGKKSENGSWIAH